MYDQFIGIDPGKSGGVAIITRNCQATAHKMPATERDISDLIDSCRQGNVIAYIEKVHSMPRQGVKSTFTFGQNYGFLRGCLISYNIRFVDVRPNQWQKYLQCQTKGDKNVTKGKAQQLFPEMKITHATADALLIAEYARRQESFGYS